MARQGAKKLSNLTKHTLFKPTRMESRQANTDNVARSITEAEEKARRKKTDRLRQLRLDAEAQEEVETAAKPAPARKRAKKAKS